MNGDSKEDANPVGFVEIGRFEPKETRLEDDGRHAKIEHNHAGQIAQFAKEQIGEDRAGHGQHRKASQNNLQIRIDQQDGRELVVVDVEAHRLSFFF